MDGQLNIILNNTEKTRLHKSKNEWDYKGKLGEIIAKYTIKSLGAKHIRQITGKDNITKGDLAFTTKHGKFTAEVKMGTIFNSTDRLAIVLKHTKKGSYGTMPYVQKNSTGNNLGWLYHCYSDILVVVFPTKVYVIMNCDEFLDTVLYTLQTHKNNIDYAKWYNKGYEYPLAPFITGAINTKDYYKDDFLVCVDLDKFLQKHDIKYSVIEYTMEDLI